MITIARSTRSILYLALGFSAAALCNSAQAQTFTDNTFANSDWTSTIIINTSQGTFTAVQDTTSGSPAPSLRSTQTYNAGVLRVAHLRNNAVYDPATSGAIATVSYSYDLVLHTPGDRGVGYALLLLQNGSYYESEDDIIGTGTWTPFPARSLNQSSFWKSVGSGGSAGDHPDFSCTGAPIQFGYKTSSINAHMGTQSSTQSGIDNWSMTVIPESKPCPGQNKNGPTL